MWIWSICVYSVESYHGICMQVSGSEGPVDHLARSVRQLLSQTASQDISHPITLIYSPQLGSNNRMSLSATQRILTQRVILYSRQSGTWRATPCPKEIESLPHSCSVTHSYHCLLCYNSGGEISSRSNKVANPGSINLGWREGRITT